MATVYLAIDQTLQREVAIKILHPHLAKDFELNQRFKQEASIAAKLEHPNILKIFDFGAHSDGRSYIVSEIIRGSDFHHLQVERQRESGMPFDPLLCAMVCEEVLRGLSEAHAMKYVHRDIKPDNVMITENGQVKITDFGIAKNVGASITVIGHFLGSPSYSSPEQVQGKPVDFRSDLYSTGIILYEALTNRLPFTAQSAPEVMMKICQGNYAPLKQIKPQVPADLDRIVTRALQTNRDDRYGSTELMTQDLRKYLASCGIENSRSGLEDYFKNPEKFLNNSAEKSEKIAENNLPLQVARLTQAGLPVVVSDKVATPARAEAPNGKRSRDASAKKADDREQERQREREQERQREREQDRQREQERARLAALALRERNAAAKEKSALASANSGGHLGAGAGSGTATGTSGSTGTQDRRTFTQTRRGAGPGNAGGQNNGHNNGHNGDVRFGATENRRAVREHDANGAASRALRSASRSSGFPSAFFFILVPVVVVFLAILMFSNPSVAPKPQSNTGNKPASGLPSRPSLANPPSHPDVSSRPLENLPAPARTQRPAAENPEPANNAPARNTPTAPRRKPPQAPREPVPAQKQPDFNNNNSNGGEKRVASSGSGANFVPPPVPPSRQLAPENRPQTDSRPKPDSTRLVLQTIPANLPVYVNGRLLGYSGRDGESKSFDLKAGRVQVRIPAQEVAGTRYERFERTTFADASKSLNLGVIRLTPIRTLIVNITGPGVIVRVNENPYALTGKALVLQLPEGRVDIDARAQNGKSLRRSIDLRGDNFTINSSLE